MKKYFIICVLLSIIFHSCSIYIDFQGHLSYYNKTKYEAPNLIHKHDGDICELYQQEEPIVYAINGIQLKECLTGIEKAIVYDWSDGSCSPNHLSLEMAQEIADGYGLELFIIARAYDLNAMNKMYSLVRPIFGIDIDFYATNFTHRYTYMFYSELFGFSPDPENYDRFHYFEGGEWKVSFRNLNDYESIVHSVIR